MESKSGRLICFLALLATAAGASSPPDLGPDPETLNGFGAGTGTPEPQRATVDGERLFGFAGIRTEDDLREVSLFSNVVLLNPISPAFERLVQLARGRDMRVAIAWDGVLFDTTATPYRLRADYRQRFLETVGSAPGLFRDLVFHQPFDEPYWNGLTEEELDLALGLMKEVFPGVPTLIVMAWPTLDIRTGSVPSDWVAFDLYFVADPVTDPMYQYYWNRMRSQNSGKPILVVADGFYSSGHAAAGISRSEMGAVARAYHDLFESEPAAVALGVFRWTDSPPIEGTRSLPAEVVREHIAIGSSITDRCGIPASEDPLAGETVLWFHECRFYARVEVDDPRTTVGVATGSSLTEESGYFWFFNESNVEITVKVLDGVELNGYCWVFMSDMTDVNYRLEIRDVWSGNAWTHSNDEGMVSIRRDTMAFPP